jgi:hypothetical protein
MTSSGELYGLDVLLSWAGRAVTEVVSNRRATVNFNRHLRPEVLPCSTECISFQRGKDKKNCELGLTIVIPIHLLANLVYMRVLSLEEIASSRPPIVYLGPLTHFPCTEFFNQVVTHPPGECDVSEGGVLFGKGRKYRGVSDK